MEQLTPSSDSRVNENMIFAMSNQQDAFTQSFLRIEEGQNIIDAVLPQAWFKFVNKTERIKHQTIIYLIISQNSR